MCLFTIARTVAIVFARSAGSEAMYCAGVLTFDGGFMDSSSSRTKCISERFFRTHPARLRRFRRLALRYERRANVHESFPHARLRPSSPAATYRGSFETHS